MQPFLLEKQSEIAEICRQHHVERLFVFGSAARDDFDPTRSDVDLLVEFGPMPIEEYARNKFGLEDDLTELFGRKVDLLVPRYIRNTYLQQSIATTKQELYAA